MTAAFYTRVMSRYRPPRTPGSPYITPEGEASLRAELHALWKIERPEVTKTVSAAAANGDRSENGDYIYGKKRLREIDARVRFLRKRLDVLQVVAQPLGDPNRVWFGAWVTVEDERARITSGASSDQTNSTSADAASPVTRPWAVRYWVNKWAPTSP